MAMEANLPKTVTVEDDGVCRWTYDLKAHGNDDLFRKMMKILVAIFAPVAVIMLVMGWRFDPLQAVLIALGMAAIGILLPALLWRVMAINPSYEMTAEYIESWPRGKGRNIHTYGGVRRIVLCEDRDLIRLRGRIGGLDMYVPPEDYEWVLAFVLKRVPENTEVTRE